MVFCLPWQYSVRRPSPAKDPPRPRFPVHFRPPRPQCHHSPSRSRRSDAAAAGVIVEPLGRRPDVVRVCRVREVGTVSLDYPGREVTEPCVSGRVHAEVYRPGTG